ncbi:MAG: hypothetical protein RBR40_13375 [Tenuifilaceae bacterium]|nr:hypothetical protein [Tenuifilaceae bacterium]
MTSDKFDIEYNKWLQQVEVGEGDSVWNEIQDELDLIETWDNISAHLDVVTPQKGRTIFMSYIKPLAAAAAIILLMLLPIKYLTDETITPPIFSEQQSAESKVNKLTPDRTIPATQRKEEAPHITEISTPLFASSNKVTSTFTAENRPIEFSETKDTNDSFLNKDSEAITLNRILARSFNTSLLLASNDATILEIAETQNPIYTETTKSSGFHFRVLEVGLVYGYKNTWLLNHETFNGLNPTKLGNTLPTFHQDIGASSTLEFNKRHQIGVEFLWKSETGQNYKQYINASFVDKSINLKYSKLQTFYYWNSKKFRGQAILGGYIARLSMAEELQEKARFSVDNRYTNLDYGLVAGYQYSISLSNAIIIKPSVRVTYNLMNIFKGDDIMPSHFKKTKNLAASFNVSLSYRFFK